MSRPGASKGILWLRRSALLLASVLLAGCGTPALDAARHEFHRGHFTQADRILTEADPAKVDRALLLLERGTVRQAAKDYENSSRDLIDAADLLEELQTYSLSRGAASLVIDDRVQDYVGTPYERALAHGMTALNHLALANWEHAAVEARRIIRVQSDDIRRDYPDDAFVRYVAGLALQLINDPSNAAMQYRLAATLTDGLAIDATGRIGPPRTTNDPTAVQHDAPAHQDHTARLFFFLLLDSNSPPGPRLDVASRVTTRRDAPYAEIYYRDRYLGRTYTLADVDRLAAITAEKQALQKAAKEATRYALKEGTAQIFEHNDQPFIAALIRIIFMGLLEQPDTRHWGTLPRWFSVASIDCPPDLDAFDVVIKTPDGRTRQRFLVNEPITRRGAWIFSMARDITYLEND